MPKTIVITGASDGIGAARRPPAAHRTATASSSPAAPRPDPGHRRRARHRVLPGRLHQARRRAQARRGLDRACPRIDVLVNNAGGIFGDRAKTADGFEKTFQVNHLAPFLLTSLLMGKLLTSRASVIQTSSSGARLFGKLSLRRPGPRPGLHPAAGLRHREAGEHPVHQGAPRPLPRPGPGGGGVPSRCRGDELRHRQRQLHATHLHQPHRPRLHGHPGARRQPDGLARRDHPGTDWQSSTCCEKNKRPGATTPGRSTPTSPASCGTAPPNSSARRSAEPGHRRPVSASPRMIGKNYAISAAPSR